LATRYCLRGYHATTPEKGALIEEQKRFNPSENWHDWLGNGVYFYQDALEWTRYWATNERHEGNIPNPAIFAADIYYDGFLDLVEYDSMEQLKRFFNRLESATKEEASQAFEAVKIRAAKFPEREKWKPRPHPLDRYVINEAVNVAESQGLSIKAVRAVFFDGEKLHPHSDLYDRQHIQIAVRDQSIIKKFWRVA
jgi:hypothetical protein